MLPSGTQPRIAGIDTFDGPLDEAYPPLSVTMLLEDDVDVSRGDMICRPHEPARRGPRDGGDGVLDVRRPLQPSGRYGSSTRRAPRWPRSTPSAPIDVNTLHRDEYAGGAASSTRSAVWGCGSRSPLFLDEYRRNRETGCFILIDEATNDTVGAGMVL